ncbi:MAG: hypothetical protein BWY00_01344 [Firmicutes bacterium ADurb.Bin153]|nr:MAG: hypothetical protein BWY00_01344 [Firmicutes bacterium ADurb.Bin153]
MQTRRIVLAAMFLALGVLLPFLTGQIPGIGSRLLPMHLPVLICGFACGWKYGLAVGFIVPIFRSLMFGMPPFPTTAVPMAFELATYGMMTGMLHQLLPKKPASIYVALLSSMVLGRLVWGAVRFAMLLAGTKFSWELFVSGAFVNALPGIVLQLALVPIIVIALQKAGLISCERR